MFTKLVNKSEFNIRRDMDFFDCNGERVHPADFEAVFAPGVWVQVDVCLKL